MADNFTAIYEPMLPPGTEDPSRCGFDTREEAQEYIFSKMCSFCTESRRKALAGEEGEEDEYVDELPGCYWEWLIVPSDKADLPHDELMEAAGWKKIWTKEGGPIEPDSQDPSAPTCP